MPHRRRADDPNDGGFTLVELLITVVVMGILVGIVVMGVAEFRGDSVDSACEADKKIVTSAASAFELKRGSFPKNVTELETAGYVKDPPGGVTYKFNEDTKTVEQDTCNL